MTATGVCVSKREEDEAMIQLLGGCTQWRLTWINIIASHLDHRGFFHLANVFENGRCSIKVPSILFRFTQAGALGCQEGGVAARVGPEPEEDVELDEDILEGGQEGCHQTHISGKAG